MSRLLPIAALLVVPLSAAFAQRPALPPASRARAVVDSLAQDFARNGVVPGTAIAVIRGRDTLAFAAYGKANMELDVPMSVRSVFRIGSVTKQFTSAAVLQLVQKGKLALTDTIGQWLPTLPAAWRGVPVSHLLNHTSGIPSYTELGESWVKRWGEEMSGADLVALTANKPFDFADGTSWKYNNTGYVILGMLIEARTGQTWHDAMAARFFSKLGLQGTRYCDNRPLIPLRAAGYSKSEKGEWVNTAYLAMSQPHAAGALCSTIGDLLTWNRALHGGKVLSAASYTTMTTPVGAAQERGYAAGIGIGELGGHRLLTHGGGINGSLTANLYVPDADLSVTVLTNGDYTDPGRVAMQLARAALGVPLDVPPKGVTLTAKQLEQYAGAYDVTLGDGAAHVFTVALKDGGLTGMVDGQSPSALIPLGNHTFGVPFDSQVRLVFTVSGASASGFVLKQNGKDFTATRKQ